MPTPVGTAAPPTEHPTDTGAASGALLGSGAVIVWNDVAPEGRDQFYAWHDKEHIPERLSIPGFRRGRRYIDPGRSPEWLTLYEAGDLSVLSSPAYLERLNAPTPLTTSTLRFFRNTARAVCQVVASAGTSSGGHVLAMRLDVPADRDTALRDRVAGELFPRALDVTGVVACHLYRADANASYAATAESKNRKFDVPDWVMLVECTRADAARAALDLIEAAATSVGFASRDPAVYSLEVCRLPLPAPRSAAP